MLPEASGSQLNGNQLTGTRAVAGTSPDLGPTSPGRESPEQSGRRRARGPGSTRLGLGAVAPPERSTCGLPLSGLRPGQRRAPCRLLGPLRGAA